MKFRVRALAFLLLFTLLLPSCKKPQMTGEITLTDMAGREVVLPGEAERVVSCYYVTTYAMLSLGLGNRLVGIEKKAESRPIYSRCRKSSERLRDDERERNRHCDRNRDRPVL